MANDRYYVLLTPISFACRDSIKDIVEKPNENFTSMAEYIRNLIREDFKRRGLLDDKN